MLQAVKVRAAAQLVMQTDQKGERERVEIESQSDKP